MTDYHQLDAFTTGYIDALLFSETDQADDSGGKPLDDNYSWNDFSEETQRQVIEDCEAFKTSFGVHFEGREEKAGIDFCFTRNGHGAGFWDGDWREPLDPPSLIYSDVGQYLTAMAKPFGTFNLYVYDGRIYHHG